MTTPNPRSWWLVPSEDGISIEDFMDIIILDYRFQNILQEYVMSPKMTAHEFSHAIQILGEEILEEKKLQEKIDSETPPEDDYEEHG